MDLDSRVRGLVTKNSLAACQPTGGGPGWSRVSVSDDEHLPLAHGIFQRLEDSGLVLNLITAHGKPIHSEVLQQADDNALLRSVDHSSPCIFGSVK